MENNSFEATTHPFIVKIWLEETAEEAGRATWRGHITHIPSGERRYLKELDDIMTFVAPYLEGMGVELGPFWRVRQWLKRWKKCLTGRYSSVPQQYGLRPVKAGLWLTLKSCVSSGAVRGLIRWRKSASSRRGDDAQES